MSKVKAVNSMSKAELITEATLYDTEGAHKAHMEFLSNAELQELVKRGRPSRQNKNNGMAGLSELKKDELRALCEHHDITFSPSESKGALLLLIRAFNEAADVTGSTKICKAAATVPRRGAEQQHRVKLELSIV
jgi:hypothetical protein